MSENEYFEAVLNCIKRNEISERKRVLEGKYDKLKNYWDIGKILVEAQGGEKRAKYGNELIKKWSAKFTDIYGTGYNYTNLKRFRQFYLLFPKGFPAWHLSWSIIRILLPIEDMNKRNYYLNMCIKKSLSKRELENELKSFSYERLVDKKEKIELLISKEEYSILDNMKNPIIIKTDKVIKSEKDLEIVILSEIEFILTQLGNGYSFIGSQYKINNQYIDLLLFNIDFNAYVVVELKIRKLKVEDEAQTRKYMNLIDKYLKKSYHNKTLGIIISKEQDDFVVNFVKSEDLITLTYEVIT